MADVAFLMLTFFMITTQISNDQGLRLVLPGPDIQHPAPLNRRNIFTVHINSMDQFMVRGERRTNLAGLRNDLKQFIMNNGLDPNLSDNPEKAVVSLKADRGTSHRAFIEALDEIQAAYYELYASRAGITVKQFISLDPGNADDRIVLEKAKAGIPMNISLAEPTRAADRP
jgi:biopolymer transport protein ExbD